MSDPVVKLPAHTRMTPEEVIAFITREEWESLLICGYHKDDPDFVVRSSAMSREQALWLIEHAKLHVLNRL